MSKETKATITDRRLNTEERFDRWWKNAVVEKFRMNEDEEKFAYGYALMAYKAGRLSARRDTEIALEDTMHELWKGG